MADFNSFVYALLNSGQAPHPGVGGGMPQTVGPLAAALQPQQPAMAPSVQTQTAQAAPVGYQMPQSTPQQGGGLGSLVQSIFAPKSAGRNQTISWLQSQGMDQGTATLLAGDKGMLRSYLGQRIQGADPKDALQLEKLQLEIGQMKNPTTNDLKEYQFAKGQGYQGSFTDYMTAMKKAGATNVDARNMGSIPAGFRVEYDTNGNPVQMVPIPGGPADAEQKAAADKADATQSNRDVATRVVTTAAQRARDAANTRVGGPYLQKPGEYIPFTDAAEVGRQVKVLQSQATIENLNQMRQQSPTGGALGNVTEGEGRMLAAKSGALDPSSPNFQRDLNDYEKTLLEVVHGKEAGDRIFEQTRNGRQMTPRQAQQERSGNGLGAPSIGTVEEGYRFKGGDPGNPASWERVQ